MVLVDTSVWVDHLRQGESALQRLLEDNRVLIHPLIIGELACGNLRDRNTVLRLLHRLPGAPEASHEEVLLMIERHRLMGRGIGYMDTHLLASALIVQGGLWTRDKRLGRIATETGTAWVPKDQ